MIRRFVYDPALDRVVEVSGPRIAPNPLVKYDDAHQEYREDREGRAGTLRAAVLERAEQREFAHKKFGDERRWRE